MSKRNRHPILVEVQGTFEPATSFGPAALADATASSPAKKALPQLNAECVTREAAHAVTSGHLLAQNVLWNLAGGSLPLLAALVSTPILMRALGLERFGILSIFLALVGYLGMFDAGLGGALTKIASEKLAIGAIDELKEVLCTGIGLMLAVGTAVGIVVLAASPWVAYRGLKISAPLRRETVQAFELFAFSIPIVTTQSAFRALLASLQRFDFINAIRLPMGVLLYLGPIAVLPFSRSLVPVVAVLIAVRLATCVAMLLACFHVTPGLGRWRPRSRFLGTLLRFGGWVTAGEIANSTMTYVGYFMIGAILSGAAISYYSVASWLALRLSVIPMAVAGVLFPAFTHTFATGGERLTVLLARGQKYTLMAVFAPALLLAVFARECLTLWLGVSFAMQSTRVLQLMLAGMVVVGMGWLPTALIQAADRPDLIAKLHLVETPINCALLWYLTLKMGVEGAALAFVVRTALLSTAVFVISARLCPGVYEATIRTTGLILAMLAVLAIGAFLPGGTATRVVILSISCITGCTVGWNLLFSADERKALLEFFRTIWESIAKSRKGNLSLTG